MTQTHGVRGDAAADVDEDLAFDFGDAFVGGQDLALVFLQLRSGKPFGINQSLFAFVVGGSQMQIWLRNFDVVAEDTVEANLQGIDAGALALALFHSGNDLLAVLAQVAEFVKFGVVAITNDSRIGGQGWRLVGDGAVEAFTHIDELVDFVVQVTQKLAAVFGRSGQKIFQDG